MRGKGVGSHFPVARTSLGKVSRSRQREQRITPQRQTAGPLAEFLASGADQRSGSGGVSLNQWIVAKVAKVAAKLRDVVRAGPARVHPILFRRMERSQPNATNPPTQSKSRVHPSCQFPVAGKIAQGGTLP